MWKLDDYISTYDSTAEQLQFFDLNCWIGRSPGEKFTDKRTTKDLIDAMSYYRISKAIVTHWVAKDYDPIEGNKLTIRESSLHATLLPAAVLLPEGTGEIPDIDSYISELLMSGVRVARLFPCSHSFSLEQTGMVKGLRALEKRRVPLIVWHTEVSWEQISKLCKSYPNLPVIVEGTGRKLIYENRKFYSLLELHENFYIELHNLVGYLSVDDIVRRFGAKRLIFGSYMLSQDPSVAQSLVIYGKFSQEEKRQIAGGNLIRLLDAVSV